MAIVHIRINGRDYDVACDDGQEEQLRLLADDIDDRVRSLVFQMGANPGEGMALLLTALTMADEAAENRKQIENLTTEVRYLTALIEDNYPDQKMQEIEAAMAGTIEEIALRIEKIAQQLEIG